MAPAREARSDPLPLEEGQPFLAGEGPVDLMVRRTWPMLMASGCAMVLLALLGYLCVPQLATRSNWKAALQLNQVPKVPSCLEDEELYAGLCYMRCALLTGGRAPHRVGSGSCCETDNDLLCAFLGDMTSVSAGLGIGGGAAIHNSPHAPGVGGVCSPEQDTYQGLCYPQCSKLTDGKSPHRVGSFACCSGSKLDCFNGHGTISSSASYGSSEIPTEELRAKQDEETAQRLAHASCGEDEEDFEGLCYLKCSLLTNGKQSVRSGPSSCCSCEPGPFSPLCCMMPFNSGTMDSYDVARGEGGMATDPHPPGMRVRCSSDEEFFQGICYAKCADLTGGEMQYRITSAMCCKYPKAEACHSDSSSFAVNIDFDKSRDMSNAMPHVPYVRPETA